MLPNINPEFLATLSFSTLGTLRTAFGAGFYGNKHAYDTDFSGKYLCMVCDKNTYKSKKKLSLSCRICIWALKNEITNPPIKIAKRVGMSPNIFDDVYSLLKEKAEKVTESADGTRTVDTIETGLVSKLDELIEVIKESKDSDAYKFEKQIKDMEDC